MSAFRGLLACRAPQHGRRCWSTQDFRMQHFNPFQFLHPADKRIITLPAAPKQRARFHVAPIQADTAHDCQVAAAAQNHALRTAWLSCHTIYQTAAAMQPQNCRHLLFDTAQWQLWLWLVVWGLWRCRGCRRQPSPNGAPQLVPVLLRGAPCGGTLPAAPQHNGRQARRRRRSCF